MANEQRGEVEVKLDKPRIFKFKTNSLVQLEKKLGVTLDKFASLDMGITTIVKFVWAALLHEMKNLTVEEAGDLMDQGDFTDITEKVMSAMTLYLPEAKESVKKTKSGLNLIGKI